MKTLALIAAVATLAGAATARAQDYFIEADPTSVTIVAGEVGQVTIRAGASGGFDQTIDVAMQPAADVTFDPAMFSLLPGQSRVVIIRVGSSATPRSEIATAIGASTGFPDRPCTFTLKVEAAPDFTLDLAPPFIELVAGEAGAVIAVEAERLHGFTGAIDVVASSADGLIVEPRTFTLQPGERNRAVEIRARSDAASGVRMLAFSATANGVTGSRDSPPLAIDVQTPAPEEGEEDLVHPPESLGASLGIITALIVHPAEGSIVASENEVIPRAFIAASGTGVIQGAWRVDGVPFDRFAVDVAGGAPVEIAASIPIPRQPWGDHRLEMAIDEPAVEVTASIDFLAAATSASGLELFAPADRAVANEYLPLFRWSLVPGADGYEVELERTCEGGETCAAFRVALVRSEWRPSEEQRREIGDGEIRWRVRALFPGGVPGTPTPWRMLVLAPVKIAALGAQSDLPASVAPAPAAETPHHETAVTPMITVDWIDGRDARGRAQLTTKGDYRDDRGAVKHTGDLSWLAEADPSRFRQESRNWLVNAQLPAGGLAATAGLVATAGLTTPRFTSGAELLGTGAARMSVSAGVGSRFGALSYYQPTDDSVPGSLAGNAPSIRALAFETPGRDSYLRLIRLDVGDGDRDVETVGILARRTISRRFKVDVEVARSEADQHGVRTSGDAMRLGVGGFAAKTAYALVLRHTDTEWVNPAHRGFSRASLSDRSSADLSLTRAFGRRALSFTLRRIESGRASDSAGPPTTQSGGTAQFRLPLGRSTLTVAGNLVRDTGEAEDRFSATDRTQRGLTLTLQRPIRRLTLVQTAGVQSTDDAVHATSSRDVVNVKLAVNGFIVENVLLASAVAASRTIGASGAQNYYNASIQPTFSFAGGVVKCTPQMSFQRSESPTRTSNTEQFRLITDWSRPGSLLAFQVSGNWVRRDGVGGVVITRELQVAMTLKKPL